MNHQIFAVIGDPVAHSLSPVMQNAAFRAMGLDAEYIAVHVLKDDLESFTAEARKHLAGFNITVPHKKNIITLLDQVDPAAAKAGSVNTVVIRDGKLSGYSTDGYGLETALYESFSYRIKGNDILFIGCGGAARAVTFHFAEMGLKRLYILNRTLQTAQSLADELRNYYPCLYIETAELSDREKAAVFLKSAPVAVQCTSLGLHPEDPPPIDPALLPANIALFDTIYKPTPLIRYARSHGIIHAAGLGMLLHQGARSFSIWTGLEAPVEVMRQALPPVENME